MLKMVGLFPSVFVTKVLIILLFNSPVLINGLKYVWGDAFDDPMALGPDGNPYPRDTAAKVASKQRNPRMFSLGHAPEMLSPMETREILLKAFRAQENGEYLPGTNYLPVKNKNSLIGPEPKNHRQGRTGFNPNFSSQAIHHNKNNFNSSSFTNKNHFNSGQGHSSKVDSSSSSTMTTTTTTTTTASPPPPEAPQQQEGCVPSRLCASTYNTTAPLYGVSLTSGQPVTIVQKFPDLLQQVVFQVCKTSECEVLQGECVQTYLPYLFLVIPLGPVTLTGQDYVLVESGCVCRPKYARRHDEPPPLPFIQPLHNK